LRKPREGRREIGMQKVQGAASEYLAHKRVAVTGVSRNPQGHGSDVVYQRLRGRGYQVLAVNPNADESKGDFCEPGLLTRNRPLRRVDRRRPAAPAHPDEEQ
jgi:predicted CoA-binding protein